MAPNDDGEGVSLRGISMSRKKNGRSKQYQEVLCCGRMVPPAAPQSSPTEKMLDWLVSRWPQPAVRARDICRFGPNATGIGKAQ